MRCGKSLVFEGAGMQASFQDHAGCAQNGLRGQSGGNVARQAGGNPAVAQCLDELIHIGRAAAAQAGYGVEQAFLDLERNANGGQ